MENTKKKNLKNEISIKQTQIKEGHKWTALCVLSPLKLNMHKSIELFLGLLFEVPLVVL